MLCCILHFSLPLYFTPADDSVVFCVSGAFSDKTVSKSDLKTLCFGEHHDPPVKQSQNVVLIVFYACVLSDRIQAISLTQADERIDSLEFPFHCICLRTVGGNQSTQRKPTQTQ